MSFDLSRALVFLVAMQGADYSVNKLVQDLAKPNGEMAAAQLVLKGSNGEQALIGQKTNPDPVVRLRVVGALGSIADAESLDILAQMASDSDEQVSKSAFGFLKLAGDRAYAAIASQIGVASEPTASLMISLLFPNSPAGEARFAQMLRDGTVIARARTIRWVGNLYFPTHPDLFSQVRSDPSPKIRAALIEALNTGSLSKGEEQFAETLLTNHDPKVRLQGLHALERAGSVPTNPIDRTIRDPNQAVRASAVQLLARIDVSPNIAARQAELVEDRDPEVRSAAVSSLNMSASNADRFMTRSQAEQKLQKLFSETNVARLKEALFHELRRSDSLDVAELLGDLEDGRAYSFLARRLPHQSDPTHELRNSPIPFALALCDGHRAAKDLIPYLKGPQDTNVIRALGFTNDPAAIPPLRHMLEVSPGADFVPDALVALGDHQALPMFIAIARDKSRPIYQRGNILFRIGLLGGPGAADTLLDVLDDPTLSTIHWQAIAGIKALTGPEAIHDLQKATLERTGESEQQAAAALARLTGH